MVDDSKNTMPRRRGCSLKVLFLVVTCCGLIFAWQQYRYERGTINRWVDSVLENPDVGFPRSFAMQGFRIDTSCPLDITEDEQLRLLMKATRWERDSKRKCCLLKIIIEQFPLKALDCCRRIVAESKDSNFQRKAILAIGLFRDESDIALCKRLLDNEDANLRSAAVDAIAIIHCPSYPMPAGFQNFQNPYFKGEVPISVREVQLVSDRDNNTWVNGWIDTPDNIPMPRELVAQLTHLMSTDGDAEVRQAAARALLVRPSYGYRLRVAEWGVWLNEGAGLTLVQSVIDEIPPFVHRSGNSLESIEKGRKTRPMIITKPIIHVAVDRPMSINMSVNITAGRPWFGYPMPDDFSIGGPFSIGASLNSKGESTGPSARDVPKGLSIQDLTNIRSGYPWLGPSHHQKYIETVRDVGFRWQSLIVLPEKADWMSLESISDPKYQWWSRLRDVPSSWVSNRNETERFLYYDGPTERRSPIHVLVDGRQLAVEAPPHNSDHPYERELLFIEVADGQISAVSKSMVVPNLPKSLIIETGNPSILGDEVESTLMEILVLKGLTKDEASGLVESWRPQFFETDGRRLLTIFGSEEYDLMCPISIDPKPTELARVGIVLTELKPHKKRSRKPSQIGSR